MGNVETKQCKKCKEQINKSAKKCPKCGSNQGMPTWAIVIIVLLFIGIIFGGGSTEEESSNNNGTNNNSSQQQEPIEYLKVTKDELDGALESNAAAAKEKYNNKYIEVTGKLGAIDSDLSYISLVSSTDEWDFMGIHCDIKNNEQKEIVKTLVTDQEITIRGKITDVGEVLGYFLDINEIIAN